MRIYAHGKSFYATILRGRVIQMKKFWLAAFMMSFGLILAACGDKEESKKEFDADKAAQVIEDGTVGFEVVGEDIEEAANVPDDEKQQIEAAFAEYIAAFNAEDLDRYMATVSKKPHGFDYNKDKEEAASAFEQFDIVREASDVTIVKYSEEEAQVFANLAIDMLQSSTGAKLNNSGRQVTVFVKEDDIWKVTSVYFIGNDAAAQSVTETDSQSDSE